MKRLLFVVVVLIFSFGFNNFVLYAQEETAANKEPTEAVQAGPTEQKAETEETEKAEEESPVETATTAPADIDCTCAKPAIEALSKSYISLEEDEWPMAIKICTDAETKVVELEKTCKCPSIPVYKKIAKAYLNYAQGGNILDGEEDIDCLKATKLYDEAEKLFEEALPKILDTKLKKEVGLISDFCSEENEFVKEECS